MDQSVTRWSTNYLITNMMIDATSRPLFANEAAGVIKAPAGWHIRPDRSVGGALQTASRMILDGRVKTWDGPRFPLSSKAVTASSSPVTDSTTVSYTVGLPNPENLGFVDTTPTRRQKEVAEDALNNGSPESVSSYMWENDSLAGRPFIGKTMVSGKDRGYRSQRASVISIGPYCTAHFSDYEHFTALLKAVSEAAPKALMNAIEYEKIRNYLAMSRHNFAAVAGTRQPRAGEHCFIDNPNSSGTLDWCMNAVEMAAVHWPHNEEIKVACSPRILEFWVRNHAKKYGTTLNSDLAGLRGTIGGYNMSWSTGGFSVLSNRLGRRITFVTEGYTPCYVFSDNIASSTGEIEFQGYFKTRKGDDTRDGETAGVVVGPNPEYGMAFPVTNQARRLRELILFYSEGAFQYEAFPNNPWASSFPGGGQLETSLAAIYGGMNLRWHFDADIDLYWFKQYADVPGLRDLNNLNRVWFAGRVSGGLVSRELNKRAMGSLLVSVPYDEIACESDNVCPPDVYPTPITLTTKVADDGPVADLNEAVPADTQSYLRPQAEATFVANATTDKIAKVWVRRENGLMAFTDDAIRDGWIPNDSWVAANGGFMNAPEGPLGDQYQEAITLTYAAGTPTGYNLAADNTENATTVPSDKDFQFVHYIGTDGDYTKPSNFEVCSTAERTLIFPKADASYTDGDPSPFLQCIYVKINGQTIDPDVAEELVGDANELARRWATIVWTQTDPTPAGASTYNILSAAGAAAGAGATTLAVLFPTAEA